MTSEPRPGILTRLKRWLYRKRAKRRAKSVTHVERTAGRVSRTIHYWEDGTVEEHDGAHCLCELNRLLASIVDESPAPSRKVLIKTELLDINGTPLRLGDYVIAYAQDYEEVKPTVRIHDPAEIVTDTLKVVELDDSKPKPVKDVPLFVGHIDWDDYGKSIIVRLHKSMTPMELQPAHARFCDYLFEKIDFTTFNPHL